MVAPAQFRGRFTGKLGVSACHPRLLPRIARALWHALDDDGGACRRCSSCAGTEWWCSRVKARFATSDLRSWPVRPSNSITVETRNLLRSARTRFARDEPGDGLPNSLRLFIEQQGKGRRSIPVEMNSDEKWSRRRAIEVHDETADGFLAEYRGDNIFDSPFRYGRHLIDRVWARCVSQLPPAATCLDRKS